MSFSLPRWRFAKACLAFACSAMAAPAFGQAQSEDEVAKQIVAAGGFVGKDKEGNVDTIGLRPESAKDFSQIDFSVFKNLRIITVGGHRVTDRLLVRLQAIPPALIGLHLFFVPITDDGVAALLRKQKSLKMVTLYGTPITDKTLLELRKLEALDTLTIIQTKITDKGLMNLAGLPLNYLCLRDNDISDVGLLELKGMDTLQCLFLEGTKVTDVGIQNLSALRNLRLLGIDSTNVTENGKIALKATLPNVRFFQSRKDPK
jgi:hypothetical protein